MLSGSAGPVATDIPSFLTRRTLYLEKRICAPSEGSLPAQFARLQAKKEYLCNRPRDAACPVPVTLLEPIFADFVDDCRNYQPTVADSEFIQELSEEMCGFYTTEPDRMHAFRRLFLRHGIELHADTIGSSGCGTDGHMMSGKFAVVVVEGKNEIGSGSCEPFAQAMMYYRKILEDSSGEISNLQSNVPSFLIAIFGKFNLLLLNCFIDHK
jgi:hypothetical protein